MGLLAASIVCVLAMWLGVPMLVRWALESKASEALGRTVRVEQVRFNPFTLNTRINGLRVATADGKGALLLVDELGLNLSLQSIWYRSPVLDGLLIRHPQVNFARTGKDQYNFTDIIERLNAQPKSTSDGKPFLFSVNNIQISEGSVSFDDQPVSKQHHIEHIKLGIPFVSNLPAKLDLAVAPYLEAWVNGSKLQLAGQVKPFGSHHEAMLDINLAPFDVTQYLGYAPTKLPVVFKQGLFGCDLKLVWNQGGPGGQRLFLAGQLGVQKLAVQDSNGAHLISIQDLSVGLDSLEPLASPIKAQIGLLKIDAPDVDVVRNADGKINFALAEDAHPSGAAAEQTALPAISVRRLEVNRGVVHWQDRAVPGTYALVLDPVNIAVQDFNLLADKPAKVNLNAQGKGGENFSFEGDLNLKRGVHQGLLALKDIKLEDLRPYYQTAMGSGLLSGRLETEAKLRIETSPSVQMSLSDAKLGLSQLALADPKTHKTLVEVSDVQLEGIDVDIAKREARLAKLALGSAHWNIAKDKQGQLDLLDLLKPAPAKTSHVQQSTPASEEAWKLSLAQAQLTGWNVKFEDRSGANPVSVELRDLGIHVVDWSNQDAHSASFEITSKANRAGKIDLAGKIVTMPLQGNVKLDIRDVDMLAIQPYVDQYFRILVTRGRLSTKGTLDFSFAKPDRPVMNFAGNVAVDEFSSLDQLNDADFLQWRHFGIEGFNFQLAPLALNAREVRLDNFYSRLILDAEGRFNLRELTAGESSSVSSAASIPSASPSGSTLPKIRIDKVLFSGGSINYSDRFVKPNYDAKIAALTGSLTGLSSEQNSVAQLDLKGAVDGTAPLQITGQLNPLRQDKFLDIQAQVKGVDLTGVSSYSGKYVGYGIDKGKLSMNLKYQIRDRKLTAENQIFLDQLTFGKRVDSPDATKLPVLFAVALLKNSQGEINVNLPVSGSLDDPQFSVGGIVVRLLVNMVTKAISAPFTLIGSMFGHSSGEELSYLDFAPGKAELTPAAVEKLKTLAKALTERPALRLEIRGQADPVADLDGVNRARLAERMRAVKAERMVKAGESVADVDAVSIDAAEYPKLLAEVYASEKVADKPRNALGLAKSLPTEEMEKLLLHHFAKQAPDLQSLAAQRARAASDWLVTEGQIGAERLFLLGDDEALEKGETHQAPAPRALFSLR
ncbi:DUF748 domain-containing protein [Uliginosibacterium gangwonense]|uniref:DUF748 domain-containing protein n=1 Tax=Uliginosibacterium gangwonense TaxID=392736 RepID=UPI0003A1F101|nr:DUF748 domain-containing protein [Uliginosibacterium gangwonense]